MPKIEAWSKESDDRWSNDITGDWIEIREAERGDGYEALLFQNLRGADQGTVVAEGGAKDEAREGAVAYMRQPENKTPYMELNEWQYQALKDLAQETGLTLEAEQLRYSHPANVGHEDVFRVEARDYGSLADETEWIVCKNAEVAGQAAVSMVENDLEDQPELFNQDFLERFVFITSTNRRMLESDEADHFYTMGEEQGLEGEELEEYVEDRMEEFRRGLDDPIEYFVEDRGIYSRDEFLDLAWVDIDIHEAAEAAVNEDGVAHFLDRYDGEPIHLENGAVAFGRN